MGTKLRLYELAEAMTLLSPRQWVRWRALSRRLYREIPSIAIPDTDLAVAHQLLRRIDLVAYALNLSPTVHRLRTLYLVMVDALFAAGAAGKITATYIDYQDQGRRKPVLPVHWAGELEPDAGFLAFDAGPGLDRTKFLGPADHPFKPAGSVDPADRFQPDRRIRLRDNELRPWPGLILAAVHVTLIDDMPKAPKTPRGHPPDEVWAELETEAIDYLQRNGIPLRWEGKGLTLFYDHIVELLAARGRTFARSTVEEHGRQIIGKYGKQAKPN